VEKPSCWNQRILFENFLSEEYPTVVFFGGIHGNEPAGILALEELFQTPLQPLRGNVYVIWGNKAALKRGIRFVDTDLNRLWGNYFRSEENVAEESIAEWSELQEIKACLSYILRVHSPKSVFFMDLHSTSSDSPPFLPFNDSLQNRKLASQYPVPLILGIEEYIEGSLMSYLNDLKCVALAFEAGLHAGAKTKSIHKAFVLYSLHLLGILKLETEELKEAIYSLEQSVNIPKGFYEILYRHEVKASDDFEMKEGYLNFMAIGKGEILGVQNGEPVVSPFSGRIFMPSYQKPTSDGFFIIRKIPMVWIRLSKIVRLLKISKLLPFLPGIQRSPTDKDLISVNPRVAFILHKEILHLMGYRNLTYKKGSLQYWVKRD
jgi:hypothetical protein